MDLELGKKWLLQQKELYGNSLYLEQLNNAKHDEFGLNEFYHQIKNWPFMKRCSGMADKNINVYVKLTYI